MLLIRGIQSSPPPPPKHLHINPNFGPEVQTFRSPRQEQSPASPGAGHSLYQAEGAPTSLLPQPLPWAHPSHLPQGQCSQSPRSRCRRPHPCPSPVAGSPTQSLLQGTGWGWWSPGGPVDVCLGAQQVTALACCCGPVCRFDSLSRKARVWCSVHLDAQGTWNEAWPREEAFKVGQQGGSVNGRLLKAFCI